MTANNAIQIQNLSYWYEPEKIILDNINLKIADNEFTAIIGQNGSGKSTLLKNISGLLRPSQGTILLREKNTGQMNVSEIAAEIGFVMQDPDNQLFEMTVYDEVAFALRHAVKKGRITKKELDDKVKESLAAAGLSDKSDVFPAALGRADRIKVVFASVLAMNIKIIMLDEPVAGQDYRGCRLIMDLAAGLHRQGYTIIMVSHNVNIIAEYAKRLIVIKDGAVFMDGKPEDVFGRPEELAQAGLLPPPVTRLSRSLRNYLPLERDAMTPPELAAMLVKLKHKLV